jgi:hypothetical protein
MKKIRRDKPFGVVIHIYLEISQEYSLGSYLYFKQANMSCFSFYLFSFFFCNIGEQEGGTGPAWGRGW